jgi:HAD superfamily hydrolase (TIGR01509 family)
MHTPIHAVIFDHDGTLVDSEPVHLACWRKVLTPYNATLSKEDYNQNLSGVPSIDSAAWLAGKFNLDIAADALLHEKQKHLRDFLTNDCFPVMPGVKSLLKYLAERNIPLAVATGASREEVEASLRHHELASYFITVASKDDVRHNKPAPDVYQLAAARLGVAEQHCLAIEDSDNGERAARAAGICCLRYHPIAAAPDDYRFACYATMRDWLEPRLVR